MSNNSKLMFPLKTYILFEAYGQTYVGFSEYAGDDILTLSDVRKRIYYNNGDFNDVFLTGLMYFDRDKIYGCCKLSEMNDTNNDYQIQKNNIIKFRRK